MKNFKRLGMVSLLITGLLFSSSNSGVKAAEDDGLTTHIIQHQKEYTLSELSSEYSLSLSDWLSLSQNYNVSQTPSPGTDYYLTSNFRLNLTQRADQIGGFRFISGRAILIPNALSLSSTSYSSSPNPERFGSVFRLNSSGTLALDTPDMVDHMDGDKVYRFDTDSGSLTAVSGTTAEYVSADSLSGYTGMQLSSVGENIPQKVLTADEYVLSIPFDFQTINSPAAGSSQLSWDISTQFPDYTVDPTQQFVGNHNQHASLDILFTLERETTITLTKPDNQTINLGDSADFSSAVTSEDSDGRKSSWYGTFQVKREGSADWEDIDTAFMDSLVENTPANADRSYSFTPGLEYQNAEFRYKYVHADNTDVVVYSNTGLLKINQPDNSKPSVTDPQDPSSPSSGTASKSPSSQTVSSTRRRAAQTSDSSNAPLTLLLLCTAGAMILTPYRKKLLQNH